MGLQKKMADPGNVNTELFKKNMQPEKLSESQVINIT